MKNSIVLFQSRRKEMSDVENFPKMEILTRLSQSLHFADEETEAQSSEVTSWRPSSRLLNPLGRELRSRLCSWFFLLGHLILPI